MARRSKSKAPDRDPLNGGQSQRQLRVAELIRQALSEILVRDPLSGPGLGNIIVTIGEIRMTPDLKRATCYVSPLGGGDMKPMIKALAQRAPILSHDVGQRVRLKFTPRLLFQPDERFDAVDKITAALKQPKVAADIETANKAESAE